MSECNVQLREGYLNEGKYCFSESDMLAPKTHTIYGEIKLEIDQKQPLIQMSWTHMKGILCQIEFSVEYTTILCNMGQIFMNKNPVSYVMSTRLWPLSHLFASKIVATEKKYLHEFCLWSMKCDQEAWYQALRTPNTWFWIPVLSKHITDTLTKQYKLM